MPALASDDAIVTNGRAPHEVRHLAERLIELERDRSDARDRTRQLMTLQAAYTKIALARSRDEIVGHTLRAARKAIGFDRAIYFNVDRIRGIEGHLAVDGSQTVEPSVERIHIRAGRSTFSMLSCDSADDVGRAGDLTAPLVDARGWYVLEALTDNEGTQGLLYVDGHRHPAPRQWEVELVRSLAAIASVSIENGTLLARTQELAMRDPLTGLYNRRAFAERLTAEIGDCHRYGQSLAYVMIDVDDFKHVNDTFGHAHGDDVLRKLGKALDRCSRANDVVGRYAGDEFVILFTNVDESQARALVARLSFELRGANISCSLGASTFPNDATDAGTLLEAADQALYVTKANGKNGFTFASEITPAT